MAGLALLPPEHFPCIFWSSLSQYFSFLILSLSRLWYQDYSLQKCTGVGRAWLHRQQEGTWGELLCLAMVAGI